MPEIASSPERPARAAAAQTPPSAAPPPAVTVSPDDVDLQEIPVEPEDASREALVGDEDVGAHAQEGERERRRDAAAAQDAREPPLRSGRGRTSAPGRRSARSCAARGAPRQDRSLLRGERQIHGATDAAYADRGPDQGRQATRRGRRPRRSPAPREVLEAPDGPRFPDVEEAEGEEGADPGACLVVAETGRRRAGRRRRRRTGPRPRPGRCSPGSFAFEPRGSAGRQTARRPQPIARPDIKSPTAAARLGLSWIERARSQARARPASGAGGPGRPGREPDAEAGARRGKKRVEPRRRGGRPALTRDRGGKMIRSSSSASCGESRRL